MSIWLMVYLVSLIVGGTFVCMSAFLGGHSHDSDMDHDVDHDLDHDCDHDFDHDVDHDFDVDTDFDADADADFDADADMDADADSDFDHDADHDFSHEYDAGSDRDFGPRRHSRSQEPRTGKKGRWLPFYSFKFWIFFLAFFGLTGSAMTFFELLGNTQTAILPTSSAVGFLCGFTVAYVLRRLREDRVESQTRTQDFIGSEAEVVVPFASGGMGKVRLVIKGRMTDLLAKTDEEDFAFSAGDKAVVIGFVDNVARVITPGSLLSRRLPRRRRRRRPSSAEVPTAATVSKGNAADDD